MRNTTAARDRFAAAATRTRSTWNVEESTDESRQASLHLYGVIGGYWSGVAAEDLVPAIRALDVDTLNVYINSPGGDVYEGIAIRNALRQHSARVVVTIDGLAASAASFIACAGDEVVMGENSEFMIHEAWSIAVGDADDMRTAGDDLDRISDNIAAMYASKAGGDAADWRALMKAETWYSASEAVAAGLADRLDSDDAGDAADDAEVSNLFDLSMYAHAGRAAAMAPTPIAAPSATNQKENTVGNITADDLDRALSAQAETFDRTLETRLASFTPAGSKASDPTWPNIGAFMKDLVAGNSAANEFYTERMAAYDGSTTADDKQPNTWIGDAIKLVAKNRKVIEEFHKETLPDKGMNLEYLQLKSNSITVAKQTAEGADLVKGKVQLQSKTAKIDTYGGWTELTKQQIERGSEQYISTANTAMDIEYARATETVVRDLLKAIVAAKTADSPLALPANATAYQWLDLIVDASELFDDKGFNVDGSYVSKDVFKKLIRLEDSNGNSLMRVWGTGMNQVGELDLREIKGDLASVQIKLLPTAPAGFMEFHDRLGITTFESAGAPRRLQDDNIINLTEAFSKYGYLAAASQFPDAIQAVKIAAAA